MLWFHHITLKRGILNYSTKLGCCVHIHTLGYLWQDWSLDLSPHVQPWFILFHNNSLIVFLTESYVCHLLVVCNTPSVWPLGHTLAREYRYQHVLLYGSTCWLVRKSFSTNTLLQLKTLSSVHGICRTFLSNVFRRMSVSSGLCLKEMMRTC